MAVIYAIVFTEFVGYWIHILIHSERVPSLSRAHMLHHLRDYGVGTPLHRKEYLSSADGRSNFLGFGMEWIGPIALIVVLTVGVMNLAGLTWQNQIVFVTVGSLWGYFVFGAMHSAMHLTGFWMDRVPLLGRWYKRARQLHDFHHLQISPDGRMQRNYGICFFWFDRLFGTFSPSAKKFDQKAYETALQRYAKILTEQ